MPFGSKTTLAIALVSIVWSASSQPGANAAPTASKQAPPSQSDIAIRAAYALYSQQKFAASADAFEAIIRTATPTAQLYYYAALANRASGRNNRAKQLCEFVVAHFPATQESTYSKSMFPANAAGTQVRDEELPESVRNALPPEMQAMLGTAAGKAAIREAMAKQAGNLATVRQAEQQGKLPNIVVKEARMALTPKPVFGAKTGATRPFTAADIAALGANGIDQSRFPNCWFEASMAALAELPRGQALMASMIRYGDKGSYVVRFPGDGKEYVVSQEFLERTGIHDKALWASIIECAQVQKFPQNAGAEGAESNQSRLEVGLQCITGCKAEVVSPSTCSAQELSTFIGGAVSSKNPIVAGTFGAGTIASLPELVVPQHAYTVIGFDASKNMILVRNPHGANSRRFASTTDPNHQEFEQMSDGVFKMNIPLFQKYFHSIARSFI
ncbi:MAG: hypothetical protein JST89_08025 [Cyanobacteria bacterium SZAS-4]|nr:hypothetical protein [Cyanobacteria bacterium SZAS-4]